MSVSIQVPFRLWGEMRSRAADGSPQEVCGLLGGNDGIVSAHYPVENVAHSSTRFSMQPQQQLQAFLRMDEQQQELAAIYHSHPAGAAYPSEKDLQEHAYPGVVHIILSPAVDGWQGVAFLLDDARVQPVELQIVQA